MTNTVRGGAAVLLAVTVLFGCGNDGSTSEPAGPGVASERESGGTGEAETSGTTQTDCSPVEQVADTVAIHLPDGPDTAVELTTDVNPFEDLEVSLWCRYDQTGPDVDGMWTATVEVSAPGAFTAEQVEATRTGAETFAGEDAHAIYEDRGPGQWVHGTGGGIAVSVFGQVWTGEILCTAVSSSFPGARPEFTDTQISESLDVTDAVLAMARTACGA